MKGASPSGLTQLMHSTQKGKKLKLAFAIFFFLLAIIWGFHAGYVYNTDSTCNGVISALFGGMVLLFTAPFSMETIFVNPTGLSALGGAILVYAIVLCLLAVDAQRHKHFDKDTACGSAEWNKDYKAYNKTYSDPPNAPHNKGANNMILSQRVFLNLDGHVTMMNNNVAVVGGSGSGKSRFFVKPNILQANCNYVITDPAGDLLAATGKFLEEQGYTIKVFNLVEMWKSDCYNPFDYIRDDLGVVMMIKCLIKNTTPAGQKAGDPFWEKSEEALLQALCFYLHHHRPKEDRSFSKVMAMLRLAEVDERNPSFKSPLDKLFDDVEKADPNSIAVKQYKTFKMGAGKTLKSILISCSVRLTVFNIKALENLTNRDTIDLKNMGEDKKALFVIIPSADSTYNFLVSMMYSQLFETLYFRAETEYKGRLPVKVRFLLDEFANIGEIPEFSKKLATMRKYDLSCSIILQNIAQLKTMYKDEWQTILGNCDSFLFLGGQEYETAEYISKELGEATIVVRDRGMSNGKSSNASQNYKTTSRKLKTPDEVMRLDKKKCLVLLRALHPFEDFKFNYTKHPRYRFTGDANKENLYVNTKDNRVFVTTEVIDMAAEREKAEKFKKAEETPTPKTKIVGEIKNTEGMCKTLGVTSAEEVKERFVPLTPTPPNPATEEVSVQDEMRVLEPPAEPVQEPATKEVDNTEKKPEESTKAPEVTPEQAETHQPPEHKEDNAEKEGSTAEPQRRYPVNLSERTQMRNSRIQTGTPVISANESEPETWDFG